MGMKNPYFFAVLIQCIYAGMTLLSKAVFNAGMNSYIFIFYRQLAGTIFLFPLAIICERRRAAPVTFSIICKTFVLALIGITLALNLYALALVYTTATIASAMINCLPVLTFIFAVMLRMESVKIRTKHGIAKIIGIFVCLGGVSILAFYRGPCVKLLHHQVFESQRHEEGIYSGRKWIMGCFLAVISIAFWGLWLVLQARVLKTYPSKLYFTSLQCLSSAIQSFVVAIAMERDPNQWKLGWNIRTVTIIYCGTLVTGVSYYLQAWVIEMKGPVFQAMSTPLNLILTIIGSALLLGEAISLGSILGGVLLALSLYIVLWAKTKEQNVLAKQVCLPLEVEDNCTERKERDLMTTPQISSGV